MAQSKLSICNQALIKISEQTIVSLDENSDGARLCNLLYDQALEEVLREYPWGCAKSRSILVKTDDPIFGYEFAYTLPADFIRLVQVYETNGEWDPNYYWAIENGKLLTDVDGISVVYIKWLEDAKDLDALAALALISKLAMKMAFARTQSKKFVETLLLEYETYILPRARSIDTHENRDKLEDVVDPWLSARNRSI